jgi:hypothetical protein
MSLTKQYIDSLYEMSGVNPIHGDYEDDDYQYQEWKDKTTYSDWEDYDIEE